MKQPGKIDWGGIVQRYTNPQAMKDLDQFLDALPVTAGYNALIAAGMAWALAGGAVLFASAEVSNASKLRAEMAKVESLQPPIPVLQYVPVPKDGIERVSKKLMESYKGVTVAVSGPGKALVSASDTDFFPQFLAAISTLENGGKNWKVSLDKLCVGKDCKSAKLSADLKIESVRVGEPPPPPEETGDGGEAVPAPAPAPEPEQQG